LPDRTKKLPPVTFVIEWENAIDIEAEWTCEAMRAFEAELTRCKDYFVAKPCVFYLYDERTVDESTVIDMIAQVAPNLPELVNVEFVATPGLTYYQLKNFGISRARTEFSIMLDSDAAPQPGWIDGILAPFADPEIIAVGGFTVLGCKDLLSKMMALIWLFNLPSESDETVRRKKIHVNNCAVRTAVFRQHPFPELPGAFKKHCGFWLREIDRRGLRWVRTADAMVVHAPHPRISFVVWRAWKMGMDNDFQVFHLVSRSRLRRLGSAFLLPSQKTLRAWKRIWMKGGEVGLPAYQRPLAMALSLCFHSSMLTGQLGSALFRNFPTLPATEALPDRSVAVPEVRIGEQD
jgi:hypothetical protein